MSVPAIYASLCIRVPLFCRRLYATGYAKEQSSAIMHKRAVHSNREFKMLAHLPTMFLRIIIVHYIVKRSFSIHNIYIGANSTEVKHQYY